IKHIPYLHIMQSFTGKIYLADKGLGYYGVAVPDEVQTFFKEKKIKRIKVTLAGAVSWISAITYRKDKGYFLTINKENRKKLGLKEGDTVAVLLEDDDSKYGIDICEEMEELFKQDIEGSDIFHALTPGKQRSLIHIASKPKSSQIRINKSIIILEYLKSCHGALDFKVLNEAFKNNPY
ncbi:MAG: DUF1905 domain-containing protein, partial [Chitinophagales bacterium]